MCVLLILWKIWAAVLKWQELNSVVWCFFAFFPTHFLFWGWRERGWCFVVSLETHSFWWIHRFFLGKGVFSPQWQSLSPFCFPELLLLSLMLLFLWILNPRKLKPVPVTDPTGFVSSWFETEAVSYQSTGSSIGGGWDPAESWRPGMEPHICSDITRKICWWLAGMPENLIFNLISTL